MAGPLEADVTAWQKTAAALKGADKKVSAGFRKGIRDVSQPIADETVAKGSALEPHRGGFSAYVARAVKPRVSLTGNSITMLLQGTSTRGKPIKMKALDAGQLRHPVWGRWLPNQKTQTVPAQAYTNAFMAQKDKALEATRQAVQQALDTLGGPA